jgi:hypothetical protein
VLGSVRRRVQLGMQTDGAPPSCPGGVWRGGPHAWLPGAPGVRSLDSLSCDRTRIVVYGLRRPRGGGVWLDPQPTRIVLSSSPGRVRDQIQMYWVVSCTKCVNESGDFKNVMNSKLLHLFGFNTYEYSININEFGFPQLTQ